MIATVRELRTFDRPIRLLALSQFAINLGFYMLMPYLAAHLSVTVGLAGWLVGLILGARNFSQQGMFLVGGTLADRLGYKRLIVAGCALRAAGFVLLALATSVPALLVASMATGFAGALFNPAVRAYVAQDAGGRRVEAFAVFNVFYQAGILLGPLIGLLLTSVAFELTCTVAALVFAGLTVLQVRALPDRRPFEPAPSVLAGWRIVFANRRFLAFSVVMAGSYVLSFQVYLALPLETGRLASSPGAATVAVGILFAVSGLIAVAGQLRVTEWCRRRWDGGRCIAAGLLLMAAAFLVPLPVVLREEAGGVATFVPLLVSVCVLTVGTMVVFPFEMDTIVSLAGDRLVATHYGLYNTICGVGIAAGTLGTGGLLELARAHGVPWVPWLLLAVLGTACALGVHVLARSGRLRPRPVALVGTA
ncbi:MFS transporter [Jiangella alba]|uniref:Predicted arabinose efflux permease, MFS family n=1 Tax=Jiangella alba TaxID=561176 RepID=A0A1H5PYM2_9ACTN|nr:MFS transporter [Jiangella alba]SEF18906.1 Predicted arabinose efflux permease, MFS family [Jiangella alba]